MHQLNFTLIAGLGEGAAVFGRLQVKPFSLPFHLFSTFSTSGDTFFLLFQVLFISLVNIMLVEEISQHLKPFLTLTTVTLLVSISHHLVSFFQFSSSSLSFLRRFYLFCPPFNFLLVSTCPTSIVNYPGCANSDPPRLGRIPPKHQRARSSSSFRKQTS